MKKNSKACTLNGPEILGAVMVGGLRQAGSITSGAEDRNGTVSNPWQKAIEGALGERAFAKMVNQYWPGTVNTFDHPDVGKWEVKTRPEATHSNELIVRQPLKDDAWIVFVIGANGHYRLVGWIRGVDCKRDNWWLTHDERGKAWFVPQSELHPWPDEGEPE